jgi:hypothetical protein
MRDDGTFNPFAPVDPPRDEELAALLRQAVGDVPTGAVDWDALAAQVLANFEQTGQWFI